MFDWYLNFLLYNIISKFRLSISFGSILYICFVSYINYNEDIVFLIFVYSILFIQFIIFINIIYIYWIYSIIIILSFFNSKFFIIIVAVDIIKIISCSSLNISMLNNIPIDLYYILLCGLNYSSYFIYYFIIYVGILLYNIKLL